MKTKIAPRQVLFVLREVFPALRGGFFRRKLENFQSWKLENMIQKMFFFHEKRFHLFESLVYENGKAEKVPVVAGRLVFETFNHIPPRSGVINIH